MRAKRHTTQADLDALADAIDDDQLGDIMRDDPQWLADLDRALAAVADVVVRLSPEKFDALCAEEGGVLIGLRELFDATGWPESYPPAQLLGHRIIAHVVARYPAFVMEPAGKA